MLNGAFENGTLNALGDQKTGGCVGWLLIPILAPRGKSQTGASRSLCKTIMASQVSRLDKVILDGNHPQSGVWIMEGFAVDKALSAAPSAYDAGYQDVALNRSPLIEIVAGHLRLINLNEGHRSERDEARKLASYLIKNYEPNLPHCQSVRKATLQDCEQFENFLKQVTDEVSAFRVDTHRKQPHKPDQCFAWFRDRASGVEIRLCKTPEVVNCVDRLTQGNNYSYIAGIDEYGWANKASLTVGDTILSSGETHLISATHDEVVSELKDSRDKTLAPLCFFHNAEPKHLIICTPLRRGEAIGMTVVTDRCW